MEKKVYTIAVQYDNQNNVVGLSKVANVNQATYNSLKNKLAEHYEQELKEKELDKQVIALLRKEIDDLKKEIALLKGEE